MGDAESMGYQYSLCSSDMVNGIRDIMEGQRVREEGGMEGCCS